MRNGWKPHCKLKDILLSIYVPILRMSGRKRQGRPAVIDAGAKVAMLAALGEGRRLGDVADAYGVAIALLDRKPGALGLRRGVGPAEGGGRVSGGARP